MKISRPVRWMIGSAIPGFLSVGGFYVSSAISCIPSWQHVLLMAFVTTGWVSFVTCWTSLLCWIGMNVFPPRD